MEASWVASDMLSETVGGYSARMMFAYQCRSRLCRGELQEESMQQASGVNSSIMGSPQAFNMPQARDKEKPDDIPLACKYERGDSVRQVDWGMGAGKLQIPPYDSEVHSPQDQD